LIVLIDMLITIAVALCLSSHHLNTVISHYCFCQRK